MKELSKNSYKGYKDLDKARKTRRNWSREYRKSGNIKKISFDLVTDKDEELIKALANADSKIGFLREMYEEYKKSTG